jgi:hypothetical protein
MSIMILSNFKIIQFKKKLYTFYFLTLILNLIYDNWFYEFIKTFIKFIIIISKRTFLDPCRVTREF